MVPVYNTGPAVMDLVRSLDAQTIEPGDLEAVFVDDGSTDDTHQRLLNAARTRPWLVVERIPNSGWPGRPRNVGLARARGDYVFFSDHDDQLYPNALERLHATAVANEADVVVGKLVRTGRPTPYWALAHEDQAAAALTGDVLQSRTVHKLFRRAFLVEHDIRFMEGRVRLEDHVFMAQVLPRARVVSVVASEPCYRWIHRTDGSNSSDTPVEPADYWPWYLKQLEVWREVGGEGEQLDAARLVVVTQAFSRFAPKSWAERTDDERADVFDAVRPLATEHLPPRLDARLPVLKRLRVQALRDGDRGRFDRLQDLRRGIRFQHRLDEVRRDGDAVHLQVSARLCGADDQSLRLDRRGDDLLLTLPADLAAADDDRRLLGSDAGEVEITVRERTTGLEWPLPGTSRVERGDGPESTTVRVVASATVDPTSAAFGRPLAAGKWDVVVRTQFLGESVVRRITVDDPSTLPSSTQGQARVYATATGRKLALQVAGRPAERPVARSATWQGDRLQVRLHGTPPPGSVVVARRRLVGDDGPGTVHGAVRDGVAELEVPVTDVGDIVDLWLLDPSGVEQRLRHEGPEEASRLPLRVYTTASGSLSVKHERPAVPSTPSGPVRRARRVLTRLRNR